MENNRMRQIRQYVRDIPSMLEKKKQLEAALCSKGPATYGETRERESISLQDHGNPHSKITFIL